MMYCKQFVACAARTVAFDRVLVLGNVPQDRFLAREQLAVAQL